MKSQQNTDEWERLLCDARVIAMAVGAQLTCVHGSTIRRVTPDTYAAAATRGRSDYRRNRHAIDGTLEQYMAAITHVLDAEGSEDCEFCKQLGIDYISHSDR